MLTTRKQKLSALIAFFVVSAAIAKPLFSNNGLVLAFRNGTDMMTVKDSSGQKNNGKFTSIVVPNSPSLISMQNTRQLTLAVWIKPNSVRSEFPVLISKGGFETAGANGGYEFTLNANGDNDLIFYSGSFSADTHQANGSLINNHLGEWTHVAVVVDASAPTIQFYVNGQSYTNIFTFGSLTDVNFDVTNNLCIGMPDPAANGNRVPFDGSMREIMIFNRALSAADIQSLFTSTRIK